MKRKLLSIAMAAVMLSVFAVAVAQAQNYTVPPYPGERIKGQEALIKVAAIQFEPKIGNKDYNLKKMCELIDQAAREGAKLIVLPELANSGYIFNSREEAFILSEVVPGGMSTNLMIERAKAHGVYIVYGITERDGKFLYNSCALVGPNGWIGTYRKVHLWDEEALFFEPGNLGFQVYNLPFGRVGMMICYDGWYPEVSRIYTLKGVDVIANPTNWVFIPGTPQEKQPAPYLEWANAHVNNIWIISADRIGTERGCQFLGQSVIVSGAGFLKGPASSDKEETLLGEINVIGSRYKQWSALANPIVNRRPDVYDKMLGYKEPTLPTKILSSPELCR
jgi:predicted amidohydrolase